MRLVSMKCPNCGGTIPEHEKGERIQCPFCETPILIDDEAQHVKFDNSESMGYEFEKGRIRAQQEAELERLRKIKEAEEARLKAIQEAEQKKKDEEFARERARRIKMAEEHLKYQQRLKEEQERNRKNNATILWIFGFILCFPIALTVLIAKTKKLKKIWKAVLITLLWVLLIIGVILTPEAETDQADTGTNTTAVVYIENKNENPPLKPGRIKTIDSILL